MSLDREEQMLVMQLADGELEGAERQRAMKLVEAKPDAAALLAELSVVGDWARESQREGQKVIETFDVAAEMEAQVSSRQPMTLLVNHGASPLPHAPAVVSLDNERLRRNARKTQLTAVVAALAVAAAALFVVRAQDRTAALEQQQQALATQLELAKERAAAAEEPAAAALTAAQPAPAAAPTMTVASQAPPVPTGPHGDVEVNGVDAKEHDVKVFYPPAEDPNASVVVWIEEKH